MKKTECAASQPVVRETKSSLVLILKVNRKLSAAMIAICIIATGILGFTFGDITRGETYTAEATDTTAVSAFESEITEQDLTCMEIEKIDSKEQNEVLAEQNRKNEAATASISETILGALMSNLESKKITNRSLSVDNYIKEAKNLIELNRKLQNFKKTPDYNLIDLSSYEKTLTTRLSRIPTLKPIPGSFPDYGWRYHPIYGNRQFHAASDQGGAYGTPIKAAGSGYVVESSYNGSSGNFIVINHGNGFVTTYMHNSKNLVRAGQYVKKGDVIGKVGSTGTATGPHLHFSVTFNGSPFNPQKILIQSSL